MKAVFVGLAGIVGLGLWVAVAANQVIQFNPGAQRSLADGTFPVMACNQNVGGGSCMGALSGIDHAFTSLTPAVCSVVETTASGQNLSTADVTPLTTGTCALRVLASGPGVGPNPGAKSTLRTVTIVP